MLKFIILALISAAEPSFAADGDCRIQPCFIDLGTRPPIARSCREDGADKFYQSRLVPPAAPAEVTTCATCGPNSNSANLPANVTAIPASATLGHRPLSQVCFARAMQYSLMVSSTATYCPGQTGEVRDGRNMHCPTELYVRTVQGWANRTLECLHSTEDGARYNIQPWLLFSIIAHESRGQVSAASSFGKGLMQLTTPTVLNFYKPVRNRHREFWEEAKSSPQCSLFRNLMQNEPDVSSNGQRVDTEWQCMTSSPEGIPRHLIVATTNLQYCRWYAEQIITQRYNNFSRVTSIRNASGAARAEQREEIIADLIMACHNWGIGNMADAARGISSRTFKDPAEFRRVLIQNGWGYTGRDGVREFPRLTRDDYNRVVRGDADFGMQPLQNGCVE